MFAQSAPRMTQRKAEKGPPWRRSERQFKTQARLRSHGRCRKLSAVRPEKDPRTDASDAGVGRQEPIERTHDRRWDWWEGRGSD